jgi:regulator of protease activity HflC (stomatin/prohibitin superfamily)
MAVTMENFLVTIVENLARLLPFRIVHDYEQAVRFTLGHAGPTIRGLERGWCFFVPLIQRVETVDATWGQVLLDTQSFETMDKVSLTVSGAIIYRVIDARCYLLSVFDTDATATLRAIVKGCISAVLSRQSYDNIMAGKKNVENLVLADFRGEIEGWGLEVRRVHLHDLIRARSIRIHGFSQPPPKDSWQ